MSDKAEQNLIAMAKACGIPEDVLRAIARLESKRIWRESLEARIDVADEALDRERESR